MTICFKNIFQNNIGNKKPHAAYSKAYHQYVIIFFLPWQVKTHVIKNEHTAGGEQQVTDKTVKEYLCDC